MNNFFLQYGGILYIVQFIFAVIIGLYFWNLLKNQQGKKTVIFKESEKENSKLKQMRSIKLSEPLSSLTRPNNLNDVVGQKEGIDMPVSYTHLDVYKRQDRDRAREMGSRGRLRMEQMFSLEAMAHGVETVYYELLGKVRGPVHTASH